MDNFSKGFPVFFSSAVSTQMEGDEKIQVLLMVERGRYNELDTLISAISVFYVAL